MTYNRMKLDIAKEVLNLHGFFCVSYGPEPTTLWVDEYQNGPEVARLDIHKDGTVSAMTINKIVLSKVV